MAGWAVDGLSIYYLSVMMDNVSLALRRLLINGANFVYTKMGHACDDSPLFCVEYYSGTPFMLSPISTASHNVSYTMPQRYSFLTPGSVMKALLDSHFFTVERRTAVS